MKATPRTLDLATWKRRQHFDFFQGFDRPFWNVCVPVDVTALYEHCRDVHSRDAGISFFAATLHRSLLAANEVEEFRYRLRRDDFGNASVVVHDIVHGGSTVLRDDETFGFGYFEFDRDFECFAQRVAEALEQARQASSLEPTTGSDDLIHYSVLRWLAFTSFQHARHSSADDSIPKIVFGKVHRAPREVANSLSPGPNWGWKMPVSVEVHHALVDGLHVGRYFERFEALLRQI